MELATEVKKMKGDRDIPRNATKKRIRAALKQHYEFDVSAKTVGRDLTACGLKPFVRVKSPCQNNDKEYRAKRLKFCKTVRGVTNKLTKIPFPLRFVWSDEHWASCNDNSSRIQWARCKADVLPRERKARHNTFSIQIFAAIAVGWRSKIVFIDPEKDSKTGRVRRLNSGRYIEKVLKPSGVLAYLRRTGRLFMQDGAKCHTSAETLKFLKARGIQVLPDWAPSSPHLNPQEEVWGYLDSEYSEQFGVPKSMMELKADLRTVWVGLDQKVLDRYASSFGSKVNACIANDGMGTK